jgi:hypothetical protein
VVEATGEWEAWRKVKGRTIECPLGPVDKLGHSFVVDELLGVVRLPMEYPETVSGMPVTSAEKRVYSVTEIGEHLWELTKEGEQELKKILEKVQKVRRLT